MCYVIQGIRIILSNTSFLLLNTLIYKTTCFSCVEPLSGLYRRTDPNLILCSWDPKSLQCPFSQPIQEHKIQITEILCQHLFQQTLLSQENNPEIRQPKICQYVTSSTSDGQNSSDDTYKRRHYKNDVLD